MKQTVRFSHGGSTDLSPKPYELEHRALSRTAAAEGMVLLKNDALLPLRGIKRVAVLGRGAGRTLISGVGSGDVNARESVSVERGLRDAGFTVVNKKWLDDYDASYEAARNSWREAVLAEVDRDNLATLFGAMARHPFESPDGRVPGDTDLEGAEACVYVASRAAGEGADRDGCGLSEREKSDLAFLNARGLPTVLVLNIGGAVDLGGADELPCVRAILYIAQPGQEAGHAVADILTGRVNPSGKLADTWARSLSDCPAAAQFGALSPDPKKQLYREGIYVGYRYFDTFGVEPRYPFGFGLSYTDFSITFLSARADGRGVTVTARVANTGDVPGKEVVQLYASCPQGVLQKEFRRLVGFAKTELLEPGGSCTVTIFAPSKAFASFDEGGHRWVAEKGLYGLWLGNSSDSPSLCAVLRAERDCVLERVTPVCPLREPLDELERPLETLRREAQWHALAAERRLAVIPFSPEPEIVPDNCCDDVAAEAERLAREIPLDRLIPLLHGEMSRAQEMPGAPLRVPGAAAETACILEDDYGIPAVILADGPAGIRIRKTYEVDRATDAAYNDGLLGSMEGGFFGEHTPHDNADVYGQFCTSFPVGTLLAQTFDLPLLEQIGAAVADEMERFHISWWLAPGLNIHRDPRCGRNFEYYSEDPLVSGLAAAAITRGVQSMPGTGTTIKHFACNNTEHERMSSDSVVGERALREIYLRGFEIAVKTAQPMCLMTSYNALNGVKTANSRDLCTTVLRGEWGFKGVVMTDWTTTGPIGGSVPWRCVAAGNDLMMPGLAGDAQSVREALAGGLLGEDEVRACAARILNVILRTNAFEDAVPYGQQSVNQTDR